MATKNTQLDKRQSLLEAAITLFYEHGFWNSSTAAIAKHAKVGTGTLFNYFPNKQALIDDVYAHIQKILHEQLSIELTDNFKQNQLNFWRIYIVWSLDNPIYHELLGQLKILQLVSKTAEQKHTEQFYPFTNMVQKQLGPTGQLKTMDLEFAMAIINHQLEANVQYAKNNRLKDAALEKQIEFGFSILWQSISK